MANGRGETTSGQGAVASEGAAPLTLQDAWTWAETQALGLVQAVKEARSQGNTVRAAEQAAAIARTANTIKDRLVQIKQQRLL